MCLRKTHPRSRCEQLWTHKQLVQTYQWQCWADATVFVAAVRTHRRCKKLSWSEVCSEELVERRAVSMFTIFQPYCRDVLKIRHHSSFTTPPELWGARHFQSSHVSGTSIVNHQLLWEARSLGYLDDADAQKAVEAAA